jgi:hypothetical protein
MRWKHSVLELEEREWATRRIGMIINEKKERNTERRNGMLESCMLSARFQSAEPHLVRGNSC